MQDIGLAWQLQLSTNSQNGNCDSINAHGTSQPHFPTKTLRPIILSLTALQPTLIAGAQPADRRDPVRNRRPCEYVLQAGADAVREGRPEAIERRAGAKHGALVQLEGMRRP